MSQDWQHTVSWIEQELGGKVKNSRVQGRWRTASFFDLEKDGRTVLMYFRGHRPGLGKGTKRLLLEMRVLQVLDQYVDALAAMHKIDISEFTDTHLWCPQT